MMSESETAATRRGNLYKTGGAAALLLGVLLLIGAVGTLVSGISPGTAGGWFGSLQNNWLVVLFKLNAGFAGIAEGSLNIVTPLDIAIMVVFCVMSLALYFALRRDSKIWSAVALALPVLGIPLFLITQTAGRSGLLIGGLIISCVMLRGRTFPRAAAWAGMSAGVLLFFAGDIGTTVFSASPVVAALIGLGYVTWMAWFALMAGRLWRLGRG